MSQKSLVLIEGQAIPRICKLLGDQIQIPMKVVYRITDGKLMVTYESQSKKQDLGLNMRCPGLADPIMLFRAFLILDELRTLTANILMDVAYAIAHESDDVSSRIAQQDARERVEEIIGKGALRGFLSALPPNLEDLLQKIYDANVDIDLYALNALFDAGVIKSSPLLQKLGVVEEPLRARRRLVIAYLTKRWTPVVEEYISGDDAHGKHCVPGILSAALYAFTKGATDDDIAIGAALASHISQKPTSSRIAFGGGIMAIMVGGSAPPKDPLRVVATFLSGHYKKRSVEHYIALLKQFLDTWDDVRSDDERLDKIAIN